MAGQQEELCFSLVLHSTSQWICAEVILNAELFYSRDIINNHFVIFKAPPTLIAHATRPKILLKFCKVSLDPKKQCSVLIFCYTLQCNRDTETIYLEPSKVSLDLSNPHGRATRRVMLESSFAQHFPMDSRRSYNTKHWTLLFAINHKPSLCHLQSSAHSNRARYQTQESANFH